MTQLELEKLVMLKYLARVEEIMDANSDGKIGAVRHSYKFSHSDEYYRFRKGIIKVWLRLRRGTVKHSVF